MKAPTLITAILCLLLMSSCNYFKNHRLFSRGVDSVLDMTIERALEVFEAFPPMVSRLQTLYDVGLGYIRVGQPACADLFQFAESQWA